MIIGADIDGFVVPTCQIVHRDEVTDEGAAGTVNREHFVEWIRDYLVPSLGRYAYGKKRSIVVMDNATTHKDEAVGRMIRNAGAVLLYTAPYSPDLNPIEKMFNIYKLYLRRKEEEFKNDWESVHWKALSAISTDKAINEF